VHPLGEAGEARTSGLERDELAVEEHVDRADRLGERVELGEARLDVVASPAPRRQRAAVDRDERAHAVPLDLVGPRVVVGELARDRRHRFEVGDAHTDILSPIRPCRVRLVAVEWGGR